jgi:hypothetical protein
MRGICTLNNVKLKDINGNDVEYTGVNVFIRDENNKFNQFTRPEGVLNIIDNNRDNVDVTNYASVNVATRTPLLISSADDMAKFLETAYSGMVVRYVGATGDFKYGADYAVLFVDEKLGILGYYELVIPRGTLNITENDEYNVANYETVNVSVKGGTNGLPVEVSTQEEIDALAIGTIFKYTGESGTYENGAMYLVEEGE